MPSDYLYLKARELQELELAQETTSPEARKRHLKAARIYCDRAAREAGDKSQVRFRSPHVDKT